MERLMHIGKEEYGALIRNTADKMGLSLAIVEKDFWVCLVLHYLFHYSKWKDCFAFKGGTCLSKVYHLIERFSEDIDLILDWRVLGYGINEPWEDRSNTKQLKFILDSRDRLFEFLKNEFLPDFISGFGQLLGLETRAYIEPTDPGTVIFAYPSLYSDSSILRAIRLEIGVLGSWAPLSKASVVPFVVEQNPRVFEGAKVDLLATTPERTFWEKATILHQEAFRPEQSLMPSRYSRHYYDLFEMCEKGVDKKAILDPSLLEEVAAFKAKFYPRNWARYDLAKFGSLRLLPSSHSLARLKEDYESMRSMIYGRYPSFDEIMARIEELEKIINSSR